MEWLVGGFVYAFLAVLFGTDFMLVVSVFIEVRSHHATALQSPNMNSTIICGFFKLCNGVNNGTPIRGAEICCVLGCSRYLT